MKFETLKEKYNYYRNLTDYRLLPNGYTMIMLDGRSFSKKIKKKFKRPFDEDFIRIMNETAKYVCEKVSGCQFAYVQSDEINLILHDNSEQDPFFGNRLCKLQSVIASIATSKFNQLVLLQDIYDNDSSLSMGIRRIEEMPLYEFDCKAWSVPNANDAFAAILYRQNDCVRNSKEAVAQNYFSHKELCGKDTETQIKMVKEQFGVDWYNDFNRGEQYGRFIMKVPFIYKDDKTGNNFIRKRWVMFYALSLNDENVSNKFIKLISGEEENNFLNEINKDVETINEVD